MKVWGIVISRAGDAKISPNYIIPKNHYPGDLGALWGVVCGHCMQGCPSTLSLSELPSTELRPSMFLVPKSEA